MARKRKIDELRSYAEYDDNFDEEGDELEDGVSAARAYVGEESEFLDDDDAWEKLQKDREKLD